MAENNQLPQVELGQEDKQLIKNTESTVHSVLEDVKDLGDTMDYSKMTIEQLAKDFYKFRREQQQFKLELRSNISKEVEKNIAPLIDKLDQLMQRRPRFVPIDAKSHFITGIFKFPYAIIKKTWHLIRHS
jgi:septation ring formation regulator EzrA